MTIETTVQVIAAIIGSATVLGGSVGGAISWWFNRNARHLVERKMSAEADGVTIKNMSQMLEYVTTLRAKLQEVFTKNFELELKVAELTRTVEGLKEGRVRDRRVIHVALDHIDKLRAALAENGIHPPKLPDELTEWQRQFNKGDNGE